MVMKILVILLGVIDIIVGFVLLFNFPLDESVKLTFVLILSVKGIASLFADLLGKIYGVVDVVAGITLFYGLSIGDFSIVLAGVLIYKGFFSLLAFFR